MFEHNTIGHLLETCDRILVKHKNDDPLFNAARGVCMAVEKQFKTDLADEIGAADLERALRDQVLHTRKFPSGAGRETFTNIYTLPHLENFIELGIKYTNYNAHVVFSDRRLHPQKWYDLDIEMSYDKHYKELEVSSVFYTRPPPNAFVEIIQRWNKTQPSSSQFISAGNAAVKFLVFLQETFKCDTMTLTDAAVHKYTPSFNYTLVLPQLPMDLPPPKQAGIPDVYVYSAQRKKPKIVYIWMPDRLQGGHLWTYELREQKWRCVRNKYKSIRVRRSCQSSGQFSSYSQFLDFDITIGEVHETWYVISTHKLDFKEALHNDFYKTWYDFYKPTYTDKGTLFTYTYTDKAAHNWIADAKVSSLTHVVSSFIPDHTNYFQLGLLCKVAEADKKIFELVYNDNRDRGVASEQHLQLLEWQISRHLGNYSKVFDWFTQNSHKFYESKILENSNTLHKTLQAIGADPAECIQFDKALQMTNESLQISGKSPWHTMGYQLEYTPSTNQLFMFDGPQAFALFNSLLNTYETYRGYHLEKLSAEDVCFFMSLKVQETSNVSELRMNSKLNPYHSERGVGFKYLMYATLKERPFIYFDNQFVASRSSHAHAPLDPRSLRKRIEEWFKMHPEVLFRKLIASYRESQRTADAARREYLRCDAKAQDLVTETTRVLEEHRSKIQESSQPVPFLFTFFSSLEDVLYESQVQKPNTLQALAGNAFLKRCNESTYDAYRARNEARHKHEEMERKGGEILALYLNMKECDLTPILQQNVLQFLRNQMNPDHSFIATELFYRHDSGQWQWGISDLSFGQNKFVSVRKMICV